MFDLANRIICVTGGAGHLGTAICHALTDAGAVVLCLSSRRIHDDRKPAHPEGKLISQICDVANERELDFMLGKFVATRHGRLDGLINCAGRDGERGINLDMRKDAVADALGNTLGVAVVAMSAAMRLMKGPGSVVNLASMWGSISPDPSVYLDLKNEPSLIAPCAGGGIQALTRYLARMAGPKGVRVNALVPGWCPKKRGPERPDYIAEIVRRVPLGRVGTPDDIAGVALFLMSDASRYVTGQCLTVDGGYSVQ